MGSYANTLALTEDGGFLGLFLNSAATADRRAPGHTQVVPAAADRMSALPDTATPGRGAGAETRRHEGRRKGGGFREVGPDARWRTVTSGTDTEARDGLGFGVSPLRRRERRWMGSHDHR
jgi:hypothetical protein